MSNKAFSKVNLPRVAIEFCTQCKWNLRAAYYAQELLQTFSTSIGEIALIPATGGVFSITITHTTTSADATATLADTVLWDRKADGGFPETKELKNRVRNVIDPNKDLGHIDQSLQKDKELSVLPDEPSKAQSSAGAEINVEATTIQDCKDCK